MGLRRSLWVRLPVAAVREDRVDRVETTVVAVAVVAVLGRVVAVVDAGRGQGTDL
jgi:hypothetical protein